jgi:hypothetical protein
MEERRKNIDKQKKALNESFTNSVPRIKLKSPSYEQHQMQQPQGMRERSSSYEKWISSFLIGGILLCLLALALISMGGCNPKIVRVPCSPAPGLLHPVELPPPGATNGELAGGYRELRDAVSLDNAVKERLAAELRKCGGT